MTGTSVSAEYSADRYASQSGSYLRSTASARVSQAIAKNAFGRATRMLSSKINIESSLVKHQVAEAYEDYLASLMSLYMSWQLSYRQLQSAEKSLLYNQEVLSLILNRSRYRIAHPEEVDRMRLEVLSAKEEVITLRDQYERYLTEICSVAGLDTSQDVVPGSDPFSEIEISGERLKDALSSSRTTAMLELLRQAGILEVRIARDSLLPSAELFAGLNSRGQDYDMKDAEKSAYAGFSLELNFGRQAQLAEYETSRIELKKTLLSGKKSILTLRQDIKNLVIQINHEKELVKLGETKTALAERILAAERRNYVIGRTGLNDLIDAMNNAEQIRTATMKHRITLQQYYVEWKRISDTLVGPGSFKPVMSPELEKK